jgi:hypothetical protein
MDLRFDQNITAPAGFPEMVSFDITPRGEFISAWATLEGKTALTQRSDGGPNAASFPIPSPQSPVTIAVVEHANWGACTSVLPDVSTAFVHIQPLPEGILVVGSRCEWTPEHIEPNAFVYGRDGALLRHGIVGDGIGHVAATTSGNIWVGYFDEGVFGNFGWGGPGPQPIGAHGINCFAPDLELITHASGIYDISDCYAMTTTGDSVLACCYTDWDVLKIAPDGTETRWSNDQVSGARAIAVVDETVALIGSYDAPNRCVVGRLGGDVFRVSAVTSLTVNGSQLPSDARIVTCGNQIAVQIGDAVYRNDLQSVRR